MFKTAIGQDSHRFETKDLTKPLVLGGVVIPNEVGLEGNSDADVVLHALTNAVSGITTTNILGAIADKLCVEQGITDRAVYLQEALKYLGEWKITHISFSVEALKPKLAKHIPNIRENVAKLVGISAENVAMTATTGEGLTDFGKGLGMQVFVVITAEK